MSDIGDLDEECYALVKLIPLQAVFDRCQRRMTDEGRDLAAAYAHRMIELMYEHPTIPVLAFQLALLHLVGGRIYGRLVQAKQHRETQ